MRDQLIIILRDARSIQIGADCNRVKEFANTIEVEAMAALHGGVTIIPSKVFGEITIPQDIITAMSNGDDDLWFGMGKHLDINLFYNSLGWGYFICPVKNGQTDTGHIIERGQL